MKKLMVAIAAAAISFAGFADDTNSWFTAGFGDGVTSTGGGWSEESTAPTWGDENVLLLEDVEAAAPVVFAADEAKAGASTNADTTVVFDTTVTFQGFEELPAIEDGAKAGVCALTDGNYYVVAYDDVGSTNKWVDTGIGAAFDVAVNVKVTVANGKAVYTFTDQFGTDGTDSLDLVDAEFKEVCYSGNGSVSTLAADTILAGVAIIVPTIEGLTVTCDKERAGIGDEVTLSFEKDTKFPSIASAKYIVGADGTLTLGEGEPQVVAQDPGAMIEDAIYRDFEDAYTNAVAGNTIVLCSAQTFGGVSSVEKDVTVDINGFRFEIDNDLEVSGALTITDSKLEEAAGLLVLGAEVGLSGSLDISEVLWENVEEVGYITGEGELILGISPNLMFAKGALGKSRPDMAITYDEVDYFLDPDLSENRYTTEAEVAYGIVAAGDFEYEETFDSVQAAINATDKVYLSLYAGELPEDETELTFNPSTVVYAATGADDLDGVDLLPEGEVVFDGSLGDYGAWVYSGEPPVVDSYEVSWTGAENAEVVAQVGGEPIDSGDEVEDGKEVNFVVTPNTGYVFAEAPYEGWQITEDGNLTCTIKVNGEAVSLEIPSATEIPATTVQISLPAATEGVAGYIVSNVTDNVAIDADVLEVPVAGGVTYTLTLGTKVEIWVVPADGYRVTGNPYVINEVTSGTTVDVQDLPSVAAIPYVAQIGDARFETLQEAFASEAEGDIVLLDNVTLTETLSVNKDFVLNLGGKTLTSTLPSVAWAIRLGDSAAITAVISNGTIVANQYGVRANQTDLTLDTVTIDSTLRALQSTTASDIDLVGCTISAAPNAEDEIAVLTKGGTLDLVDTTVNSGSKGLDLGGTVATIDADSVISVDGVNCAVFVGSEDGVKTQLTVAGKIEATVSHTSDNDSIYAISGNGTDEIGADVTISEGADISVTADETAIYWPNAGTLTVNGGSITGGTAIWAKSGNVVVNGGEISANGAAAPYAEDNDGVTPTGDAIVFEKLSGAATGYPNNLTASITGGTITSVNGAAVFSVARAGETALGGVVSGGTFSSPISDALCAAGFIPKANEDGTYGVKEGAYVAQVADAKFETLDEAFEAVEENGTVVILQDLTVESLDAITKDLTIDANGCVVTLADAAMTLTNDITVVCSGETLEKGVKNEAQITIAAGKTLDLSALSWGAGVVGSDSGTASFTLEEGAVYKQGLGAVWDDAITNIFTAAEHCEIKLEKSDDVATITAEAIPPMFMIGGTGYASWDEAYAAAKSGDTLIVSSDAEIGAGYVGTKKTTIDLNGHKLSFVSGWLAEQVTVIDSSEGDGQVVVVQNGKNINNSTLDFTALSAFQLVRDGGSFYANGTPTIVKFPADMPFADCAAFFGGKVAGEQMVAEGKTYTWDGSKWVVEAILTIAAPENGTLETSATNAVPAGTVVTVTATPDDGYQLVSITTNGEAIVGTEFVMPEGDVTVAATFEAAQSSWDIPGGDGGINALVKEDGTKYVEFTSITFTATGATVGLKAAKIAAQAETFGLVCKTDLTKADTFVINASLSVAEGDPDAKNGLFTIVADDLSGYDQLFVVGVGPAAK